MFDEHYKCYFYTLLQRIISSCPHPYWVRSWGYGFSHGLKKCPPDTSLHQCAHWCRPFESLLEAKKKHHPTGGVSFWRRVRDSNPRFLSESLVFKTSSLNRSDNSPGGLNHTIFVLRCQGNPLVLNWLWRHRIFHTLQLRWYLWNIQPTQSH